MTARENPKLWKELRQEILLRDREKCKLCGVPLGLDGMQLDHIIALRDGGKQYDKNNLWSLCGCCHIYKTTIENKQRRLREWLQT